MSDQLNVECRNECHCRYNSAAAADTESPSRLAELRAEPSRGETERRAPSAEEEAGPVDNDNRPLGLQRKNNPLGQVTSRDARWPGRRTRRGW